MQSVNVFLHRFCTKVIDLDIHPVPLVFNIVALVSHIAPPAFWTFINGLVDSGNTVIIIEHNPEVIKSADYIIDLGPGGGDEGGMVIAEGTPEEVSMNPHSYTGDFLKKKLNVPSPSNIA